MTMSSLKSQLRHLQQKDREVRGVAPGQQKRPSYLFDEGEAADYDNEAIYNLGLEGFTELCKIDRYLSPFRDRLFNERIIDFDFSQMTKSERSSIDSDIRRILLLLCPHFLSKDAGKVIEWLVRKWRVNELMVDELMTAFFPYHDTKEWVRLVQIIYFKDNDRWSFLFTKVKQDGNPISRRLLAQRCQVDTTILTKIFKGFCELRDYCDENGEFGGAEVFFSFYTLLVLESVEVATSGGTLPDNITLQHFNRLEMMISKPSVSSAMISAMTIFISLCQSWALSDAAIKYFIRKLCIKSHSEIEGSIIRCIFVCLDCGYLQELEQDLAQIILELPLFNMTIQELQKQSFDISRPLQMLKSNSLETKTNAVDE